MLNVDEIENGTVIDHIRAGKGRKVLELLGIGDDYDGRLALVMNVPSKRIGKKDIVKIAGRIVSGKSANLISLVSPNSTINIVENRKVSKKFQVEAPLRLLDVGTCPNPNCISNFEDAQKMFTRHGETDYRCDYCERVFKAEEIAK